MMDSPKVLLSMLNDENLIERLIIPVTSSIEEILDARDSQEFE